MRPVRPTRFSNATVYCRPFEHRICVSRVPCAWLSETDLAIITVANRSFAPTEPCPRSRCPPSRRGAGHPPLPGRGLAPGSSKRRSGCPGHRPSHESWCSIRHGSARWRVLQAPLFCAAAMLVRAHNGGINHRILVVRVGGQRLEHAPPHAGPAPARVPGMNDAIISKARRQIPPRDPCAVAVQYRFDEQPVVPGCSTHIAFSTRQQILDPLPLVVPQSVSSHGISVLRTQLRLLHMRPDSRAEGSNGDRP